MKHVAVVDTPSIKQFVFGTDTLREIRGASALLDRLNRLVLPQLLGEKAASVGGQVEVVFSAGGAGQFIFDGISGAQVGEILDAAVCRFASESDGLLRLVYGVAEWSDGPYADAVRRAFGVLHRKRDWGTPRAAVATAPFLKECESLGYLPVTRYEDDEWVSDATTKKRLEAYRVRREAREEEGAGPMSRFYTWLEERGLRQEASMIRLAPDFRHIGGLANRYISVVYCDGNNMGRLVQELPSPGVARAFSQIVDVSVHEACFQALVDLIRCHARGGGGRNEAKFAFDILLLGGDDLVVALPATAGLPFAMRALELFEQEVARRIQESADPEVRAFFQERLGDGTLSLSAGVATARDSYPFYLILELAEDLLKSAKAGATRERLERGEVFRTPSYIDFQSIEGGATARLGDLRAVDYQVGPDDVVGQGADRVRRTLRPYSLERMRALLDRIGLLSIIPSSKRHAIWEAALEPRALDAEIRLQEILGRLSTSCRNGGSEQVNWWLTLTALVPPGWEFEYPWYVRRTKRDGREIEERATIAADLIELLEHLGEDNPYVGVVGDASTSA